MGKGKERERGKERVEVDLILEELIPLKKLNKYKIGGGTFRILKESQKWNDVIISKKPEHVLRRISGLEDTQIDKICKGLKKYMDSLKSEALVFTQDTLHALDQAWDVTNNEHVSQDMLSSYRWFKLVITEARDYARHNYSREEVIQKLSAKFGQPEVTKDVYDKFFTSKSEKAKNAYLELSSILAAQRKVEEKELEMASKMKEELGEEEKNEEEIAEQKASELNEELGEEEITEQKASELKELENLEHKVVQKEEITTQREHASELKEELEVVGEEEKNEEEIAEQKDHDVNKEFESLQDKVVREEDKNEEEIAEQQVSELQDELENLDHKVVGEEEIATHKEEASELKEELEIVGEEEKNEEEIAEQKDHDVNKELESLQDKEVREEEKNEEEIAEQQASELKDELENLDHKVVGEEEIATHKDQGSELKKEIEIVGEEEKNEEEIAEQKVQAREQKEPTPKENEKLCEKEKQAAKKEEQAPKKKKKDEQALSQQVITSQKEMMHAFTSQQKIITAIMKSQSDIATNKDVECFQSVIEARLQSFCKDLTTLVEGEIQKVLTSILALKRLETTVKEIIETESNDDVANVSSDLKHKMALHLVEEEYEECFAMATKANDDFLEWLLTKVRPERLQGFQLSKLTLHALLLRLSFLVTRGYTGVYCSWFKAAIDKVHLSDMDLPDDMIRRIAEAEAHISKDNNNGIAEAEAHVSKDNNNA